MDVKLPDVLAPSRVVAGQRILLEGPYCRRWYLGERVPRQSIGSLTFSVPASIPVSMLSEATTELAIVEDMTGQPATEFIIPGGDYAAYRESHLAPVLDIEEILIAAREARDAEEAEAAARGRSRGIRRRRDGTSTSRGAAGAEAEGFPVIPLTLECTRASGQRFVVPIPESEFPNHALPADFEV